MNKKIFRFGFFATMITLAVSVVFIMGVLYSYFEKQLFSELKSQAFYLASAAESYGAEYISSLNGGDKRITLISPDGVVLADTDADPSQMDNHSQRKEIAEAVKNGSGTSVRYSDTLTRKTIYYAVKLKDGNILRISATHYSVAAAALGLVHPMLIVIILALIISYFLSGRVSKAIIRPINDIDLENPEAAETYDELSPLLKKISAQNRTIARQIKEAEKSREEFRLITENMSEGFLIIDSMARLLTCNTAALRLLGYPGEMPAGAFELSRSKGFVEVIEKALSGERAESSMSAGERSFSLIASPVFEEEKPIGAVIVILDMTEQVRREQLRREFTSNVSHELKTPLTSISGFAEIMMEGGAPAEVVTDFSKSIYDEARRLISLVNDIIRLSELDEKGIALEKKPVDLKKEAEAVIEALRPAAEKKSVTFNLIGENVEISGVESIINEMLYNLCDNAVKYNKEGGFADVIISSSRNYASVTVRDTGIGIPFAEQSRIFERFYRVDKSHSKAIGGTGLGLSIVKHGAILHGAEIKLESEENKGTSITLTFKL